LRYMNDFNCINFNSGQNLFDSAENLIIRQHHLSKTWLDARCSALQGHRYIIVTHHAPSIRSIHDRYRTSTINGAFYANLEGLIDKHKPTAWIHGHVHSMFAYKIGSTHIVCNPVGYPGERAGGFVDGLVMEVSDESCELSML